MDMYKLKITSLQQEILRVLFFSVGEEFNQRELSKELEKSPTAIAKSIKSLEKEKLVKISKNKSSGISIIELNLDNKKVIEMKRVDNLRTIYESDLFDFLEDKFVGKTIILFGSYCFGEDTKDSDIDIAIIGNEEEDLELNKFEKKFGKEIRIQFYPDLKDINKNLKESLFNGIVLSGGISL